MAEDKRSFLIYADLIHTVKKLSKEQEGELFNIILDYVNDVNDGNPIINDLLIELVFEPIKQQLKRDLRKWDTKIQKRSEAGKIGGIKSGEARKTAKQNEANEANASHAKQNEANEAVNVTVTVNDTVTDTVTVTDTFINIKESKEETPTLFKIFLTENQIENPDALEFLSSESFFETKAMQLKSETDILTEKAKDFLVNLRHRDELEGKPLADLRSHFVNWFKLHRTDIIPEKKYDYLVPKY